MTKRYSKYKDSGVDWIGEIPAHWEIKKLKSFLRLPLQYGANVSSNIFDDNNPRYIRITDITSDGKLKEEDKKSIDMNIAIPYLLNNKDVLLARSGSVGRVFVYYSKYGRAAYAGYLIRAVLKKGLLPEFLFYYSLTEKYSTWISTIVIKSTIQNINAEKYKQLPICIPGNIEQKKIVLYLDKKTKQIDSYITAKEKEIELLKEYKQAEIAKVVTEGINPNVKMKDSGVSWIGKVPEHWGKYRNKDIFIEKKNVVGEEFERYTLLSLTKKGIIKRDMNEGKGKFPKDFRKYKIVKKNYFIFCFFDIDETPRTIGLSKLDGMITGAYTIFIIKNAVKKFVYYYYLSIDDKKGLRPLYTSLRKVIPASVFLRSPIYLPSIEEQTIIADYIEKRSQKIDLMINSINKEINYIKEYKQRLISDVVMGRINVQPQ